MINATADHQCGFLYPYAVLIKTKAGYAGYLLKKSGRVRRGTWPHSGAKLTT